MMALILLLLIAVPLQTLTGATELFFSKIGERIYVETDPKHFAMYDKVANNLRIVSVDERGQYSLEADCGVGWTDIDKIDRALYDQVRETCLAEKRGPQESPQSYTWSDTLSSDRKDHSLVKLEDNTRVYSSQYFPAELAWVIISGQIVTFVHFDGTVRMKTMSCLHLNEKILIEGIKKMDSDRRKPLFASTGEEALRKHLKHNPIDASPHGTFQSEQKYVKTYPESPIGRVFRAVFVTPASLVQSR